jgi:hypothetical protein
MNRLFKQDVDGLGKHPVAELPCRHLTQGHIVKAVDQPGLPQTPFHDGLTQSDEGRVMDEILIDAKNGAAVASRGYQGGAFITAGSQGFFQQDWNAAFEKWHRRGAVQIGGRKDMNAIDLVRSDGLFGCGENVGNVVLPGKSPGGRFVKIDDRVDGYSGGDAKGLGVHLRNITGTEQTHFPHNFS